MSGRFSLQVVSPPWRTRSVQRGWWRVLLALVLPLSLPLGAAQSGTRPTSTGLWFLSGLMTSPRGGQTSTLLPNGQVLIAGGTSNGALDLASAELYNPRTNAFTATGSLTFPTEQATATLLRTGKVLVVGGANQDVATGLADLYSPATGTFTATGGMPDARVDQTATLLPNGQVLIAGGCNGTFFGCTITTNTAELYDPATGTFTATGSMASARMYDTATLLPNGQVLIAGGAPCTVCNSWSSAELYNPATGTFTPTGSMQVPRANAAAVLLRDGQVLVAGGCATGACDPAYKTYASAELYNPRTGTWRLTGRLTVPRAEPTATLLPTGQVLVAGGANGPGIEGQPVASAELYTPLTGRFTATASMHAARDLHTATLLPYGGVLVTGSCPFFGGTCNPPVLQSAEVYWYK